MSSLSSRPPTLSRASTTSGSTPAASRSRAAVRPARPAPTTTTSASRSAGIPQRYPLGTVFSMASPSRQPTREEEGRLSLRTLAIASLASAAAAIVVSQFWIAGTPIAAALTPVIVTLVSEMLHRPTEAVARRITTNRPALMAEAMGSGPPDEERVEDEAPTVARDLEAEGGPVRVYRQGRDERRGWRERIHPRVVAVTAALAFLIAAAALTLPELIAGGSIGKRDGGTTLLGGGRDRDRDEPREPEQPAPQDRPEEQPTTEEPAPEETEPEEVPPPTETTPGETVPTTPTPTLPEAPVQP
jgi:hypothetical protein